jgi:hypothetical protein
MQVRGINCYGRIIQDGRKLRIPQMDEAQFVPWVEAKSVVASVERSGRVIAAGEFEVWQ